MQTKAEEKRKAYTCLVYTRDAITKETLNKLENEISLKGETDPDGLPCLKVIYFNIKLNHFSINNFFLAFSINSTKSFTSSFSP